MNLLDEFDDNKSVSLLDDMEETEDFTGRVRRTKNGRPYVLANPDWTPEEARARGYTLKPAEPRGPSALNTRVTTYVSCLEDTYALGQWQEQQVALGLASRPSLVAAVQRVDLRDERSAKEALNEITAKAKEVAGWKEKADLGTDFHTIAEQYDRGRLDWPMLSDVSRAMLNAYATATDGWEYAHIEQGMVNDEFRTYGTPDRLRILSGAERLDSIIGMRLDSPRRTAKLRVTDIKTGRIDYGKQKMALQMACYALSALYDPDTGIRTELDIDQEIAEIVHLPYGQGRCDIYPVYLEPAIEALRELVPKVRAHRAKTDWFGLAYRQERDETLRVVAERLDGGLSSGLAAAWPVEPPEAL